MHHAPREAAAARPRRAPAQAPRRHRHPRDRGPDLRHARQRRHRAAERLRGQRGREETARTGPDRLQRRDDPQERRFEEHNHRPDHAQDGHGHVPDVPFARRVLSLAVGDDADETAPAGPRGVHNERDGHESAHNGVESDDHAEDTEVFDGDTADDGGGRGAGRGGGRGGGRGARAPITKPHPSVAANAGRAQ